MIMRDLDKKINDLKMRRDSILNKSQVAKFSNYQLLRMIRTKNVIKEADTVYHKVNDFNKTINKEAGHLSNEYGSYEQASNEFERFALFTGIAFKKASSID